jgi:hypothetical protein
MELQSWDAQGRVPLPFLSIAALFHGCWHPRYRHERLRYLIEQLPRILFFAQRRCEKLNNLGLTHLHGQVSGRRVSRHLIVLDPLSCPIRARSARASSLAARGARGRQRHSSHRARSGRGRWHPIDKSLSHWVCSPYMRNMPKFAKLTEQSN